MNPGLRDRLLADGWEERFSAAGDRLQETAEYYRALGFEVRVEDPADVAAEDGCTTCFDVPGAEGPARVLFTRVAGAPHPDEEDLFE